MSASDSNPTSSPYFPTAYPSGPFRFIHPKMYGWYWAVLKWTLVDLRRRCTFVFQPDALQGRDYQSGLRSYMPINWRNYFVKKLAGKGLEIGPLHQPMPSHDRMTIDYVDYLTVAQLRSRYPELHRLPLVEPDLIDDAQVLDRIPDSSYDFLIAAHVIEHMRDPVRALQHWCRVTKPGGLIYLVVPDKRWGFDRPRVRTTLEHLILDYSAPSSERDFEHYLDYAIHVQKAQAEDALKEAKRLLDANYSIHYHVFIPRDAEVLVKWVNENVTPVSIIEGPVLGAGTDEFHLLLRVGTGKVRE